MFILYINDLPPYVNSADANLYADDTTLVSPPDVNSTAQLRHALTNSLVDVEKWACANRLPLNETKTKSILITGKRLRNMLRREDQQLNLTTTNGTTVGQVQSAKVLHGLEIDDELTFYSHLDKLSKKLSQ